jgi:hypothetical protein
MYIGAMKEDVNWWHSFLLKGITLPSFSSESDEEWSSDDETKETDFGLTIAKDASAQIEKGQCTLVDKKSVHKILLNGNCDQLCHLLHYPYWYEEDYNLGSGSYVGKFSEYEVTREILWALQGSGTSFIALSSPKVGTCMCNLTYCMFVSLFYFVGQDSGLHYKF